MNLLIVLLFLEISDRQLCRLQVLMLPGADFPQRINTSRGRRQRQSGRISALVTIEPFRF